MTALFIEDELRTSLMQEKKGVHPGLDQDTINAILCKFNTNVTLSIFLCIGKELTDLEIDICTKAAKITISLFERTLINLNSTKSIPYD